MIDDSSIDNVQNVYFGTRPRLLDLFCGAGGAAKGYHLAGFEVVGVDLAHQPRYPYAFYQDDALTVLDTLAIPPAYTHYLGTQLLNYVQSHMEDEDVA